MNAYSRGFTVLEMVVALGILGVILLAFLALLSPLPLASIAEHKSIALAAAESHIASIRAGGYASVPVSGSWSSTALTSLPSGAGALTSTDYNATTKQVVVTVTWAEPKLAGQTRSVSLTTLITEIGGLP